MPQEVTGATIDVPAVPPGVTIDLGEVGSYSGGTTFDIAQGDTVNLTTSPSTQEAGTFSGGTVFDVGAGRRRPDHGGHFQDSVSFSVGQARPSTSPVGKPSATAEP